MAILKRVSIRNFKGFRGEISISLSDSTYLIGPNNSGKTAVLSALKCFFDSDVFIPEYLNKTELASRRKGSTQSIIGVTFDVNSLGRKAIKKRMLEKYGEELTVLKYFTWGEKSDKIQIVYKIRGKSQEYEELDADVRAVIQSISISYIHPQEGDELLQKAQEKFKQRLFNNWGRHSSGADQLKSIQAQWVELRKFANSYLSGSLTSRLQKIWPNSSAKVDLPDQIEDIVAISDITFKSNPQLPEITLTSHGTGAQSTILYQTHYLLDSDKTLHAGMYHPVWLLEEPESFLHADIASRLSMQLSSEEWLENIQIVVSTHSAIMLAASRQSENMTRWVLLDNQNIVIDKITSLVTTSDISDVGKRMGDAYFDLYFMAAARGPLIFCEDSRTQTKDKLIECGLNITDTISGSGNFKRHVEVLSTVIPFLRDNAYYILDSDDGLNDLKSFIEKGNKTQDINGWEKYCLRPNIYLVLPPKSMAIEGLFDEWNPYLEDTFKRLYNSSLTLKDAPPELSSATTMLRKKKPTNKETILMLLAKNQDVKDLFWAKVKHQGLSIAKRHKDSLNILIHKPTA